MTRTEPSTQSSRTPEHAEDGHASLGATSPQYETTGAADVKAYYSYWWENPEDIRAPVFSRLNEEVIRLLGGIQGNRALDLGSGKGAIVRILRSLGYSVTAVEFNAEFIRKLGSSFPDVDVVGADIREWVPTGGYDVATCIEVAQVLTHDDLAALLERLRPHVSHLVINISNASSFHGIWVRLRRFQAPFIVNYTPRMALGSDAGDRKSTRLNSSHGYISYAVFCLKK